VLRVLELRRLAVLAGSEGGYQFLEGRLRLKSESLLKPERSRKDSEKCLLLTRKTLAFISKYSDKVQLWYE
jgi:hypothetical protein